MELADFAQQRGQLYVPACKIMVNGRDLLRDELVAASQVEVDLTLGGSARFSFTIAHAFDDLAHTFLTGNQASLLDLLALGTSVDIYMGYGDLPTVDPSTALIRGVITEVFTGFAEGSTPELLVSGYDTGFPLTVGKNTQSWSKSSDSDVAYELATRQNLDADVTDTQQLPQIEQNQESDFEFLKKLADRNFFQLYVRNKTLYFGPPQARSDDVLTLNWGESLLSFKPQANLAAQVAVVEVHGWDIQNDKAIIGRASGGDEALRLAQGQSAAQLLQALLPRPPTLQLRMPVATQAEADSRAKSALDERAKDFLSGEGECFGIPELLPDTNIALGKMGPPFSRTYYVEKTTHKYDSSGYRVRFSIKGTTL